MFFNRDVSESVLGLRKLDSTSLKILSFHEAGEVGQIRAFAFKGNTLVYGTSSGEVYILDSETFQIPEKLTRRGLGITCIDLCNRYAIICNPQVIVISTSFY